MATGGSNNAKEPPGLPSLPGNCLRLYWVSLCVIRIGFGITIYKVLKKQQHLYFNAVPAPGCLKFKYRFKKRSPDICF